MHLQTSLCLLVLHYWLRSLVWSLALSEHNHQPPHCCAQTYLEIKAWTRAQASAKMSVQSFPGVRKRRGCQQGNHSSHHLLWILGRGCATLLGCSTACLHSSNVVMRGTVYTGWQPCCSSSEGLTCFLLLVSGFVLVWYDLVCCDLSTWHCFCNTWVL